MNEATLLPVLAPLAPAKTLIARIPAQLGTVLDALGTDPRFVAAETDAMTDGHYAKTSNRSVVGIMNEFSYLADAHRHDRGAGDLVAVATYLAGVPCSPLDKRHTFPDREVAALVAEQVGG